MSAEIWCWFHCFQIATMLVAILISCIWACKNYEICRCKQLLQSQRWTNWKLLDLWLNCLYIRPLWMNFSAQLSYMSEKRNVMVMNLLGSNFWGMFLCIYLPGYVQACDLVCHIALDYPGCSLWIFSCFTENCYFFLCLWLFAFYNWARDEHH